MCNYNYKQCLNLMQKVQNKEETIILQKTENSQPEYVSGYIYKNKYYSIDEYNSLQLGELNI